MVFRLILILLFCIPAESFSQEPQSEEEFRKYFMNYKDSLDPIEGIWNVSTIQEFYRYDTLYNIDKYPRAAKVVIRKKEGLYESYDLSGEPYDVNFFETDVKGVYLYRNFFRSTGEYSNTQAVISTAGIMQYTYEFPENYLRIQLGDSYEEGTRVVNQLTWKKEFPDGGR